MIKISKMADYGVLLLGHFAQHDETLTSSSELAETYHMPRAVVANLLKEFSRAGLLESRRGLRGGYRLARPAAEITLLDMLNAIEGPVHLIECAADDATPPCSYEDVCPSRSPMQAVHRKLIRLFQSITLAELMHAAPAPKPTAPATP
jgi:FeS assembly SUF system regulator